MSMFSAPCSHSGSHSSTTLLYDYNNPIHLPTTIPDPLCATSWFSTVISSQFLTTLSTIKLNRLY